MLKNLKTEKVTELLAEFGLKNDYGVGDGWYSTINNALTEVVRNSGGQVKVDFVKEKWGALRIGVSYPENYWNEKSLISYLSIVEEESTSCCEFCGSYEGTKHLFGFWIKTVCPECAEANNASKPKTYENFNFQGNFR